MSESQTKKDQWWEHFEHGADHGVRGVGPTREAAFAQAALALTALLTDPTLVEPRTPVDVTAEGPDDEFLFVAWLDALIYEMAVRKMLFSKFDVAIEDGRLRATAWGEPVDVARHQPTVEIKGATFTELRVRQDPQTGLWVAQCVVDV